MGALGSDLHWGCRIVVGCILFATTRKVSAFLVMFAYSGRAWLPLNTDVALTQHGKTHRHLSTNATPMGAEKTGSEESRSNSMEGKKSATEETSSVPRYRRLYDAAMKELKQEMTLEAYPIPEGLEGKSATVGKGRSEQVELQHRTSM